MRITAIIAATLALGGCSAEDVAEMEADKLDGMNLLIGERAIADALIEGYKKEKAKPA